MATAEALSISSVKNWLVVDFDGTCSIDDTTPMLPRLAGLLEQERQASSDDAILQARLNVFSQLEQEYFLLYQKAKAKCQDDDTLFQALDRLDDVSNVVTDKVSESGVLKGLIASQVSTEEMKQLLERHSITVAIRNRCGHVLSKIHQSDAWNLGVLSINWCPSLICASLQPHILSDNKDGIVEMPIIWSNHVDSETGKVSLHVPGALAKRDRISKLQKENTDSSVIYVGDSSTDLAALVEADVGILMGNSESTIRMAEQWGVPFLPLKSYPTTKERENVIWTTDCWSDLASLLLGNDDEAAWLQP